jgi:1-acyl-sn-glycerol-3-phosphate acyltransferase
VKGLPSHPNPRLSGWSLPEGVPTPNLWYRFCRFAYGMLAVPLFKLRVFNRHYEPARGAALYICNHQSYLDPAVMSLALKRPMNFMARDSLFRIPILGAWIRSLNSFPVKRDVADTGALKEALRRLKRGEQLVVFAEGTRTHDGRVGQFLPGVAMLARRAAEWVVPTTIEGAFDIYPRGRALPGLGQVLVAYSKPLGRSELDRLGDKQLLAVVRRRIIAMQSELRLRMGRPPLPQT